MAQADTPEAGGQRAAARAPQTEEEFAQAVRAALRQYLRTDLLRDNPLLHSRLVAATLHSAPTPLTPVQALKDVLRAQVERIGDAPKLAPLQRVLELTWLTPVRSQQAAAENLHLSWSTYRRRLADATQLLTAHLWEAECALARTESAEKMPPRQIVPAQESAPAMDRGPATTVSQSRSEVRSAADVSAPVTFVPESAVAPRKPARWRIAASALLLIAVAISGRLWWRDAHTPADAGRATTSSTPKPLPANREITLAVLPFLNMDADPSQQYLADGLTEELINRLGRFPNLRVAARTSAFVFRNKAVDVREAARALGVANVLEGSVQRSADRVRVRVALVSADNGYELWASEFDPAARDLLIVEDEISKRVIEQLQPRLNTAGLEALRPRAAPDPAAYDFYLVGLQYLNRRTPEDIDQAITYFRRAIQADPDDAQAWSGVAMAYAILRDYNNDAPPDTHYDDALVAARKAVQLDPQQSRAHAVLGLLYEMHWQWGEAEREFLRALQLDPSDATARQWYAMYLWFRGDMRGALREMRRARDLDPLSPIVNADLGRALIYVGDVDGALAQCRAAIALEPRFALAHLFLAEGLMTKNRNAEALAEMRNALALTSTPHPASYLAVLGLALDATGDRAGARAQLDELEARAQRQYVSGVSLALLEWEFGEKDRAFANLERAVHDHDHLMLPVVAARFADWRGDPRFLQLLREMSLPVR